MTLYTVLSVIRSFTELLALSEGFPFTDTVSSVTDHTDDITPHTLFVCRCGTHIDGHRFLKNAVQSGAAAVILSDTETARGCPVPYMLVSDTDAVLLPLYLAFAGNPQTALSLYAVTGTNGKTSTVWLTDGVFRAAGEKTALLSTIENRIGDTVLPSAMTTPTPRRIAAFLRQAKDAGVRHVFLEASSHALAQKRLSGLPFRTGIFTNLTEDHLDYHKTAEAYFAAKRSLFYACEKKLICTDDSYGKRLSADTAFPDRYTYGVTDGNADFSVTDIRVSAAETRYRLRSGFLSTDIKTPLCGAFAVTNTLAAAACGLLAGLPAETVQRGIASVSVIAGRMERIVSTPFSVWIDYAHTPDALKKAIAGVRAATPNGRVLLLFGCGGDREREKRPKMARIAAEAADMTVLTADNSRTEDTARIFSDIEAGFPHGYGYIRIDDRKAAIETVLSLAAPGDSVLLAGKGHETYEEAHDGRRPFSERSVVLAWLETHKTT